MLKNVMRGLAICCTIVAVWGMAARGASVEADRGVVVDTLVGGYVEAWKSFYPSRAAALGMRGSIRDLEDRSAAAIEGWIDFNRRTLDGVEDLLGRGSGPVARRAVRGELSLTPDQAVDLRLLRAKIRRELATWDEQRIHRSSLGVFVDPMAGALGPVLESPLLSVTEKEDLLGRRLEGMVELANAARDLLEEGRPTEMRRSLEALEETKRDLETELVEAISESSGSVRDALEGKRRDASDALERLRNHVVERTIPASHSPDTEILGRERYARELALYTDSALTPEELEALALGEIRSAKRRIADVAEVYWRETSPEIALPESSEEIVAKAFADLEARRPANNAEYLETLREYRREVEWFVRDREIATVPERHTLSLELAPESAGPMARVGYVSTAPPFDPNPWTTWYLATIPDSHPEQERVDFWRSFNYPFKKFIVIHELFPGHYMQLKLLRENLHEVRILFPWSPFTEGWATFCEEVAFEHGYAEGDHLVRLAQLRKRLENANRAYMSVQAHVNGWSEEEVFRTSVDMSLLAPQFAKSLWNRLMRWPFQMTTYMLGGLQLQELYDAEKDRLGPRFNTRDFMDTVLRLGPIPIEEIGVFLELATPSAP